MSNHDNDQKGADFLEVNEELMAGLGRCRAVLNDYRAMLAANSNEADEPEMDEDLSRSG